MFLDNLQNGSAHASYSGLYEEGEVERVYNLASLPSSFPELTGTGNELGSEAKHVDMETEPSEV